MKTRWTCLAALLCAAIGGTAMAEVVRLRGGRLIQGKVVSHTGLEVVLHRYDTGGQVSIPFAQMLPEDKKRLEEKLGYRNLEGFVKTIDAQRITLRTGTQLIGVLEKDKTTDQLVSMVRRGISYRYKRSQIAKLEPVKVPASEVYTPEKIYELEKASMKEDSPRDQYELARYAESLGLFEQSLEHYKKAEEIDPAGWKLRTTAAIERLAKLIKNKEALQAYRGVISAKARHEYGKARELLQQLSTDYPGVEFPKTLDPDLLAEIEAEEKAYFNKELLRNLYMIARNKAMDFARQRTVTIDEGLTYAKGDMHKDVLAALATKLKIDEKRVKQYFNDRQTKHHQRLNIGPGTFLIQGGGGGGNSGGGRFGSAGGSSGDTTVTIGGKKITVPGGVLGGGRNGGGKNGKKKVDPRTSWWTGVDSRSRRIVVYAAWVKKHLTIERVDRTPCSKCGGRGQVQTYTTKGPQASNCGRCQGKQFDEAWLFW